MITIPVHRHLFWMGLVDPRHQKDSRLMSVRSAQNSYAYAQEKRPSPMHLSNVRHTCRLVTVTEKKDAKYVFATIDCFRTMDSFVAASWNRPEASVPDNTGAPRNGAILGHGRPDAGRLQARSADSTVAVPVREDLSALQMAERQGSAHGCVSESERKECPT